MIAFPLPWLNGAESTSRTVRDCVRGLLRPERPLPAGAVVTCLANGTRAFIYPLPRSGTAALAAGLQQLSPASRYQRFLSSRERFTSSELEFLTSCDGIDHIALVMAVEVRRGKQPFPVAVARCVRDFTDPEVAEVAIAVADRWQGRGVGRSLMQALHLRAWDTGIRRWRAYRFAENTAMARLLEYSGEQVSSQFEGPGCVEAIYALRTPSEPLAEPAGRRGTSEWAPLICLAGAAATLLVGCGVLARKRVREGTKRSGVEALG